MSQPNLETTMASLFPVVATKMSGKSFCFSSLSSHLFLLQPSILKPPFSFFTYKETHEISSSSISCEIYYSVCSLLDEIFAMLVAKQLFQLLQNGIWHWVVSKSFVFPLHYLLSFYYQHEWWFPCFLILYNSWLFLVIFMFRFSQIRPVGVPSIFWYSVAHFQPFFDAESDVKAQIISLSYKLPSFYCYAFPHKQNSRSHSSILSQIFPNNVLFYIINIQVSVCILMHLYLRNQSFLRNDFHLHKYDQMFCTIAILYKYAYVKYNKT